MKQIFQVAAHIACWGSGFTIVYLLMVHSEARQAYGLLTGWWFACYLGYVIGINTKAIVPSYLIYVCGCTVSFTLGSAWFYQGAGTEWSQHLMVVIILQGLVFISPIVINAVMRKLIRKMNFLHG